MKLLSRLKRLEWKALLAIAVSGYLFFSALHCVVSSNDLLISWYFSIRHSLIVVFAGDPTTDTDAYIVGTYYYPDSKSLGKNAIAMAFLMDYNTVRDVTRYPMKLIATNSANESVTISPRLLKEDWESKCRFVSMVATSNALPDMTKLEIYDGHTKMEIPFKRPRETAPSPVVICISPQFLSDQWQLFIAHAHVAHRFGGHMHIYITSMIDSYYDLLLEYQHLGYVTLDFWTRMKFENASSDSLEPNANTELRNQAGAQTDCLFQYKEAAEFITFFDMDDILIPRGYDSYYDEFTALHMNHPNSVMFHFHKREMMVVNKPSIEEINFEELFGHNWFVNERIYGKTMVKPVNLDSMWVHESFNIPYRKKTLSSNFLLHLQKPIDVDGRDIIPYKLSKFEIMDEMKLDLSVLTPIQDDFQKALNSSSILKISKKLNNLSYYFSLIYRCYYEKFYRNSYDNCPNGEGCFIPQRSDLNCVHAEVDYKSGPKMKPITYHYHVNPRWSRSIGCHI